jgi:teichuronic acid biosynthesis glycosyltransferase TuaH
MALKNKHIFILGTAKFDGPYESTSYTVAKFLARDNHVYYIENPYTWRDYFREKGQESFNRRREHFKSSSSGLIDTAIDNLKIVITPPLLSINFLPENFLYRQVLKINEATIAKRIKKIVAEKGIRDLIYINSFNFHYPNISDLIKPALSVYQCVDPLIIPFDMKHGITSEPIIVRKSDLVVCTSRQLYREKKQVNPETYFVANAADISHSSKALNKDLTIHPEVAVIPSPRIGYFGNIERRMDFPLLQQVAKDNPDKNFVFVGPVSPEFIPEWFYNVPNIRLIGRQPYDQMPSIIKGFDIAMIPFKKDDVSSTIFPLKLFEYLGAGKPVIATDFNPDLAEFTKDTVHYCADAESFNKAIETELGSESDEKIKMRLAVAEENTWDNRLKGLSDLLESKLASR